MGADKGKEPNQLRYEREFRGWSQADVAKMIGCDTKTVGRWERGESLPNHYSRRKLCEIFEKNAEELGLRRSATKDPGDNAPSEEPSEDATAEQDHIDNDPTNSSDLSNRLEGVTADQYRADPEPHIYQGTYPNRAGYLSTIIKYMQKKKWMFFILLIILVIVGVIASKIISLSLVKKSSSFSQVQRLLYTYSAPSGKDFFDIEYSPHGNYIVCVNKGGTAEVIAFLNGTYRPITTTNAVDSATWSPDETRIASANSDNTVRIWDPINGVTLLRYSGHTSHISDVAWSPDGTRIASSDVSGTVQIWNATTASHIITYRGHTGIVWWIAWSPDSKYLASGGQDHTVQVWDATTGKTIFIYKGHSGPVYDVMWSPNGERIVSASADKTVQVWDATTGAHILTYHGHNASVQAAVWSPDGKLIASAGVDATIHAWNSVTGKTIFVYYGHTNTIWAVTWSPDRTRIASASSDGTVRVWQAPQAN